MEQSHKFLLEYSTNILSPLTHFWWKLHNIGEIAAYPVNLFTDIPTIPKSSKTSNFI